MEFYNSRPDLRDKFEILALHESRSVQTLAQMDEKNAANERDIWKAKLPFPVLIDKEGRTVRRYGITGYPTLVLIDPDGNQMKAGSLDLLKEKLGVKDPSPVPPSPPPPSERAQAKEFQFTGSIAEASGAAQPEAEIARWFLQRGGTLLPQGAMKADAQGRFSWKVQADQLPLTYIVLDKSHALGALVKVTAEALAAPTTITLKPLAEVRFTPRIENDFGPVVLTTSFGWPDATAFVVQSYEGGPYRVPEGEYELNIRGDHLEVLRRPIRVKAGETLAMDDVLVKLGPAARNFGKPAMPVEFAEARGLPPDFTLDDLKGKWVLLEFWGFW